VRKGRSSCCRRQVWPRPGSSVCFVRPSNDAAGNGFGYDAWNRLTTYHQSTIHRHDALGRRSHIQHTNASGTVVNRDLYYSADWQILEERGVVLDPARYQYVWSPLYVDGLVTRYRDAAGDGTYEEQLFALTDANWNVTGVVDVATGAVVERYAYDPYGRFEVYTADWSQQRTASAYQWDYFHQGGRYQYQTGLFHFRHRDYSPTLMRWISQDPIGFGGGDSNLYRYLANNPANRVDPLGLTGDTVSRGFWQAAASGDAEAMIAFLKTAAEAGVPIAVKNGVGPMAATLKAIYDKIPAHAMRCSEAATRTVEALKALGQKPYIIKITDKQNALTWTFKGRPFTQLGHHEAVVVGEGGTTMVYDTITGPAGLTFQKYYDLLVSLGIYPVITRR
jgi:RHS repeat-associated protein